MRTLRQLPALLFLAAVSALLATLVSGAQAAFPGLDGKIVFVSTRDGNGDNYITGEGEIYVMNADGSNQTRLTFNAFDDTDPAWSPNGQKIAFASDRAGNLEIYVMNKDGTNQTRLTNNAAADFSPAWSPDGTKLVFVRIVNGTGEIGVMNADGTGQTNISNHPDDDQAPAWSVTNKIVFQTNRDGDDEIGIMNPDGSGRVQLTDNSVADYGGDWAPDGLKVYFTRDPMGSSPTEIGVIDVATLLQTRLTTNTAPEADPVISPTGLFVAYTSVGVGGVEDIFKMTAGGLLPQNLTNSAGLDFSPDWSSSAL
jgi:Tol biopolymer transport system component